MSNGMAWMSLDFFARGLHTRTAVARLPLRQLGFLITVSIVVVMLMTLTLTVVL